MLLITKEIEPEEYNHWYYLQYCHRSDSFRFYLERYANMHFIAVIYISESQNYCIVPWKKSTKKNFPFWIWWLVHSIVLYDARIWINFLGYHHQIGRHTSFLKYYLNSRSNHKWWPRSANSICIINFFFSKTHVYDFVSMMKRCSKTCSTKWILWL